MNEARVDKRRQDLKELNEKFKELETYEELKAFEKHIDSYGEGYRLVMKQSRYDAYGFSHLFDEDAFVNGNVRANIPKYKNRVHYLISDSVSTRESYVKNLHRNIEVI